MTGHLSICYGLVYMFFYWEAWNLFCYMIIKNTSCKRSVACRVSVAYAWNSSYDACIYFKVIKHVKICYYIFLSMILVEKAQYNSCCFLFAKRKKITMQWFHVKTFELVCYCFYCLTSILLLFCFVLFLPPLQFCEGLKA